MTSAWPMVAGCLIGGCVGVGIDAVAVSDPVVAAAWGCLTVPGMLIGALVMLRRAGR